MRALRSLLILVLFPLSATVASAQTFLWTVDCPSDTVVGPVTVLANTYSGTSTLTAGTPSIEAVLPTNNITRVDDPAAAPGTYTGVLSCTLTFGGVTVPFTRSFSLDVPAGQTGTGQMTTGATAFVVNLGAQGQVDVSVPVDNTLGFDRALVPGGFIIVPLIVDTTLLLTAVVPLPGWSVMLNLTLLILVGLVIAQRRWRTVR